jgi:hypothetical protein
MTTFSTANQGCIGTTILCWFNPMMLRLIGCTVLILAMPCFGQSSMERRLECLSAVETQDNDSAIGKSGEISRYQITPSVWRRATKLPLLEAVNPFTAKNVATAVWEARISHFIRLNNLQPTDFEAYALWSRPAVYFTANRHLTKKEAFRCQCFANLCGIDGCIRRVAPVVSLERIVKSPSNL